jgi:antitoxin component YwqK of YwqJK toxin-antitoxin module
MLFCTQIKPINNTMLKMKNTNLFFTLFCIFFLLAGCTEVKREFYDSGKLKSETHYRFGKETGTTVHYHFWYPVKSMEIEMKRGKKHGKFIKRFFTNQIEMIAYYKNDLIDGTEIQYHINGLRALETHYSNGIKNGVVHTWYDNGMVKESGAFVNDLFDGKWENYDERGLLIGEGLFVKGTGNRIVYDEMGRLQTETNYVNNHKEGLETHFLPSGEIEKTFLFKEDRIIEIDGVPVEDL